MGPTRMKNGRREQSFYSETGFRMIGGQKHVTPQAHSNAWVSLAVLIGGALLLTTYLMMS